MTSLYEVLKRSKTAPQLAPDMFTALWAKSITAGETIELSGQVPLSFTANGAPLIDYTISGNMEQSGTPTPDNPITPQGTGERTGNLFDIEILQNNKSVYTNGNVIDQSDRIATVTPINVSGYSAVTLTYAEDNVSFIYATFNSGTLVERVASKKSGYTINTTNCDLLYICFYSSSPITTDDVSEIMLNLGSEPLPYEPYGYKTPILSAGQTNNIYLGNVQTTRYVRKSVLDGTENWEIRQEGTDKEFLMLQTGNSAVNHLCICTHYSQVTIGTTNTAVGVDVTTQGHIRFRPRNVSVMSLDDFKAWLAAQYDAGTPVTVWYVLATPETGIVNEPLMKIGDYADTVSKAQAGVAIPTNNGSTTVDVDTELKPSEVYIKYHTR